MKKQKLLAVVLAAVMTLSLTACAGGGTTEPTPTPTTAPTATTAPTEAPTPEPTKAPEYVTLKNAAITFEDGKMDFVKAYMKHVTSANINLSIADFNGSKALKVDNLNGKTPWIGIDLSSLLGENITKLAKVEMVMGTSYEDGSFYATSGEIYTWYGTELEENMDAEWSVYMAKKNPKVISVDLDNALVAGNIMLINLKDVSAVPAGAPNPSFYIDDICFYDAEGKALTADTSVAFAEIDAFSGAGADYTNLCTLMNPVVWDFACSEGGWSQNGFDMPDDFRAALVPGAVVEIAFKSDDNTMWAVMPDCGSWTRVDSECYINNSGSICQIPYEAFVAAIGNDDPSTWGARLQCEAKTNWEVFSIRVGQKAPHYVLADAVEWPEFQCSEGGWSQNGFDMPDEIRAALVPGSVVEISFKSEDGTIWLVMPDCGAWCRVGKDESPIYDGKCYVTFEQLVAAIGNDDPSTWGARMQAEGRTNWEVFAIRVGKAVETPMLRDFVNFEGFACSEGGWSQNGFEMTDEFRAALVPGSVVEISFKSEDNTMWLVMPDCGSWTRVDANPLIDADNGKCYITFEDIAAAVGNDDPSTWGGRLQCEAKTNWEVYGVRVGKAYQSAEEETPDEPAEPESGYIEETVGIVGYTGSYGLVSEGGWTTYELALEDLLGGVNPEDVLCIKFTCDKEFGVGYQGTDDWHQDYWTDSVIMKNISLGSNYYIKLIYDMSEATTANFTWEVYVKDTGVRKETTGVLAYTGNYALVSEGGWTTYELSLEELLGTVDPALVTCIKFSSDQEFGVGYTGTDDWHQDYWNGSVIFANVDLGSSYYIKLIYDLSAAATSNFTWEVYTKDFGTVAYTGSTQMATEGGWKSMYVEITDLLGSVDPTAVTCVKFSCDKEFVLGYASTNGWFQETINGSIYVEDMYLDGSYYLQPALDLSEATTATLTWDVYTK